MIMTKPATKDGATEPNPAPKVRNPRRLRIGEREITAMCELLAQRLTEREGLQTLGIAEATWYRWKSHARNHERLRRFLDRIVGTKITTHLANIEAAAVGAGPHKRPDWRASAYALSATDPTRFQPSGGVQVQVNPAQPAIPAAMIEKWISLAYGERPAVSSQIVDTTAKLLPETTPSPPIAFQPGAGVEDWMPEAPPRPARKCPPLFKRP